MPLIALIVWIMLMILWLCFGCWWNYTPDKPYGMGNALIPWVCVLILGLFVFGAFGSTVNIVPSNPTFQDRR